MLKAVVTEKGTGILVFVCVCSLGLYRHDEKGILCVFIIMYALVLTLEYAFPGELLAIFGGVYLVVRCCCCGRAAENT